MGKRYMLSTQWGAWEILKLSHLLYSIIVCQMWQVCIKYRMRLITGFM